MKKKIRVMVMGAGGPAGLNFINCLRLSNDYYIVACDINKWHLELCDADIKYIVPSCIEHDYINIVKKIIKKEEINFIHAQPDMEVEVLSEKRSELSTCHLFPCDETIKLCRNKVVTNMTLEHKKVPVPLSFQIFNIDGLEESINILKRISNQSVVWIRAIKGAGSKAALPIKTPRHAEEWIHYWKSTKRLETEDFMLSEFLPGREFAFQSLWYKGKLLTSQTRIRLEYLMGNLFPSGQSSSPSVAMTICDDLVEDVATKAVLAVDKKATGIFCVDLKENYKSIPCVTEINCGRFFTTSFFFATMGCNMPDYYIKLGLELDINKFTNNTLNPGVYWIRSVDTSPVLVEEGAWQSIDGRSL
jgi:carbamoyl-phosphate synthase large subunit